MKIGKARKRNPPKRWPEAGCLFGAAFSSFDHSIRIDNYDLPSDLTTSSEFLLERAQISTFSLETNSAGGVDVRASFWYERLMIIYDHGSTQETFDKTGGRWGVP